MAYLVIAAFLLVGGLPIYDDQGEVVGSLFGIRSISTDQFGGFMLNLIAGFAGIVLSLPIGILLALGRRSKLPVIRFVSIGFIEVVRGVPLITLLFVAVILLELFLPPGLSLDQLIRVMVMITAFSSAYMAEVIRGGLQTIPNGQFEAAQAVGLGYWKTLRLVILPQALKISIPGIVNTFIGLFKDTTLVVTIGMFDILGHARLLQTNPDWIGEVDHETFLITALFFFVICFFDVALLHQPGEAARYEPALIRAGNGVKGAPYASQRQRTRPRRSSASRASTSGSGRCMCCATSTWR